MQQPPGLLVRQITHLGCSVGGHISGCGREFGGMREWGGGGVTFNLREIVLIEKERMFGMFVYKTVTYVEDGKRGMGIPLVFSITCSMTERGVVEMLSLIFRWKVKMVTVGGKSGRCMTKRGFHVVVVYWGWRHGRFLWTGYKFTYDVRFMSWGCINKNIWRRRFVDQTEQNYL